MSEKSTKYDFSGLKDIDKSIEKYNFDGLDQDPHTTAGTISNKLGNIGSGIVDTAQNVQSGLTEGAHDFGKGLQQGTLMGGADETAGLVYALLDKINGNKIANANKALADTGFTGDVGPTTSAQMYRESQQEENARQNQADERSPWLYGGGQLTGAITSGLATGGASAIGLEAAGLKLGSKLALKEVLKQGGKAALAKEIGKRALVQGALAAPEGAVMSALSSDQGKLIGSTPEEREKLLADTTGGALTGGLWGGGLSLGMDVAPIAYNKVAEPLKKWTKDFVEDSPFLRQTGKAYERGTEGINYASEKEMTKGINGRAPLSQLETNASEDLINRINTADDTLGKNVGNSLEAATQEGVKINVDTSSIGQDIKQLISENPHLFDDRKSIKKLNDIMNTSGSGFLTPLETKAAVQDLDTVLERMAGDTSTKTNVLREKTLAMRQILDSQLKAQIPKYQQAAQRFEEFRRLIPETVLKGRTSESINDITVGGLKNSDKKLQQGFTDLISGVTRPGTSTDKAKEVYSNLTQNIERLKATEMNRIKSGQVNPGEDVLSLLNGSQAPVGDIGQHIDQAGNNFLSKIKNYGDESAIRTLTQGVNPNEGASAALNRSFTGIANTGRGMSLSAANMVGRTERFLSGISPSNIGKKLYNLVPEEYQQLAQQLKNSPSSTHMGQALEDALTNNDIPKRNAILFSMLQNPNIRKSLISADDIEENK